MPQDKRAYNRAYCAYTRDLVAGKPSPTALERLGRLMGLTTRRRLWAIIARCLSAF